MAILRELHQDWTLKYRDYEGHVFGGTFEGVASRLDSEVNRLVNLSIWSDF